MRRGAAAHLSFHLQVPLLTLFTRPAFTFLLFLRFPRFAFAMYVPTLVARALQAANATAAAAGSLDYSIPSSWAVRRGVVPLESYVDG